MAVQEAGQQQQTKTLEQVREFFAKDRFATENGAVIEEVGEHHAKCSLKIAQRHMNAVGGVMGGVPFMLADFTFAVATNWQQPGVVSLHSDIAFLGTAKGERLIAEAECVKDGRSTCYYRVSINDDLGRQVAVVNITGFRTVK